MGDLTTLHQAILCGDSRRAEEAALDALAADVDACHLFTAGVIPAMHEARRRFQAGECPLDARVDDFANVVPAVESLAGAKCPSEGGNTFRTS